MGARKPLSALSAQLSLGCALYTLICLVTMGEKGTSLLQYFPTILLVYSPAVYGANCLLLRRPRTVQTLAFWNGAIWAALMVSIFLIDGWGSFVGAVFMAAICLGITVQGAFLCLEPPTLSQLILRLDINLLLLVLFVGYTAAMGFPLIWNLPIALGCVCAMLGTMSARVSGRLGGRGRLVVAAAFLVLLGLVWLLVRFVAAPAGGGLITLWNGLLSGATALGSLIARVIQFLLSLLPTTQGEMDVEPLPGMPQLPNEETTVEIPPGLIAAGIAIAVIAVGIALFFILRALGRLRVSRHPAVLVLARPTRKRISLLQGLLKLLDAWRRSIQRRVWLWRNRTTPAGLFFILDRRSRSTPWRRKAGETPRQFLSQLQLTVQDNEALSSALAALGPAVDTTLYGPPQTVSEFPLPSARLIRRKFRRAMWRQSLRGILEKYKKKNG